MFYIQNTNKLVKIKKQIGTLLVKYFITKTTWAIFQDFFLGAAQAHGIKLLVDAMNNSK